VPAVTEKAEWALRWIDKGNFAERLVAFAAVKVFSLVVVFVLFSG
jgi:ribonucleoside-diphosphate reductase beta chain